MIRKQTLDRKRYHLDISTANGLSKEAFGQLESNVMSVSRNVIQQRKKQILKGTKKQGSKDCNEKRIGDETRKLVET